MDPEVRSEILSSTVKLRILDAVSVRPRTLQELASITGITVPGVLRHLKRLMDLELVLDRKLSPRTPRARRVYLAKAAELGDYSTGDLTVVRFAENNPRAEKPVPYDLESLAGDILFQRRRIKDEARRLRRMIDDLVEDQGRLTSALGGRTFGDEERLILQTLLTEETIEEGARVLSRYYGIGDRRSIDEALAKARRSVGK